MLVVRDTAVSRSHGVAAKRRGGHPPPMKGFRPGKEPAHLKKRRAKAQLGSNASWAQKAAVDAVAGRKPEEVRAMVRRWNLILTGTGVVAAVAGVALYTWSVPAGVATHAVAAALLFLAYRVRRSAAGLEEMSGTL